jgi:hypothetical protein
MGIRSSGRHRHGAPIVELTMADVRRARRDVAGHKRYKISARAHNHLQPRVTVTREVTP